MTHRMLFALILFGTPTRSYGFDPPPDHHVASTDLEEEWDRTRHVVPRSPT